MNARPHIVVNMTTNEERQWAAVATVIKMEMAANGLTQAKIAAAAGVGREAMSNYLLGKRDMPFSVLVNVAAALNLTPRELFELAESRLEQGK